MATNGSTYLQDARLNWVKGTSYPAHPTTLYMALFTTQPANDGTGGTEVSGGSYARASMTSLSTLFGTPTSSNPTQITNSGGAITFATATGSWGTVTSCGIYDASSGGNLIYVAALSSSVTVASSDIVSFASSALVITEGNASLNESSGSSGVQYNRLQWVRGFNYFSAPTTLYIALFTIQPASDGTGGTEVSGGSYARYAQAKTSWGSLTGATPTIISNTNTISFTEATADWGTVVGIGIYSAISGGTFFYGWDLSSSVLVKANHIFTIPIGSLTLSED